MTRLMKKKTYEYKEITVVKLDPEQALLVVCVSGGQYFGTDRGGSLSKCFRTGGVGGPCVRSVRGVRRGKRGGYTASAEPS